MKKTFLVLIVVLVLLIPIETGCVDPISLYLLGAITQDPYVNAMVLSFFDTLANFFSVHSASAQSNELIFSFSAEEWMADMEEKEYLNFQTALLVCMESIPDNLNSVELALFFPQQEFAGNYFPVESEEFFNQPFSWVNELYLNSQKGGVFFLDFINRVALWDPLTQEPPTINCVIKFPPESAGAVFKKPEKL